jgi:hypothetical protein
MLTQSVSSTVSSMRERYPEADSSKSRIRRMKSVVIDLPLPVFVPVGGTKAGNEQRK